MIWFLIACLGFWNDHKITNRCYFDGGFGSGMPISIQNLPKKGKQESKIYHSRFILTSAVQGQVRKTIDRIYSRAMGTNEFSKGCMGLSVYLWCVLPIPLRLPIRNSFLVIFEGKMWKENGIRKTGIQHLPSKVHSWSFLRRKLYKEHGTRKARIQHLPSKVYSHQRCARTGAQNCR